MKNSKSEIVFEFYTVAYLIALVISAMAFADYKPFSYFTTILGISVVYVVNVFYRIYQSKNNI